MRKLFILSFGEKNYPFCNFVFASLFGGVSKKSIIIYVIGELFINLVSRLAFRDVCNDTDPIYEWLYLTTIWVNLLLCLVIIP